ncbi:MAG: hypothetical protein GEU73_10530 [Chloroflexi bacterium]|nr:hypothetical protein [Chloroflexota bacterium]
MSYGYLISLGRIEGLRHIRYDDGQGLRIGAIRCGTGTRGSGGLNGGVVDDDWSSAPAPPIAAEERCARISGGLTPRLSSTPTATPSPSRTRPTSTGSIPMYVITDACSVT